MRYYVNKTEEINPSIDSPEWKKAEAEYLKCSYEGEGLCPPPETYFKLLRGPRGLSVLMHTDEKNLRAEVSPGGEVCLDSCMEFFYKPSPWDTRYFNFEINPKGVTLIGLGADKFDRTSITDTRGLDIVSSAQEGNWTLKFYIPDEFTDKHMPEIPALSEGNKSPVAKANFCKCGDRTDHPHYATWSEITVDKMDFHIPDFFGEIVFI